MKTICKRRIFCVVNREKSCISIYLQNIDSGPMEIKADDLSGFYMLPKRWANVKDRIKPLSRDELILQRNLCLARLFAAAL